MKSWLQIVLSCFSSWVLLSSTTHADTATSSPKVKAGDSCEMFNSICVDFASCWDDKCKCDMDYYPNANNTCSPKLSLGEECQDKNQCLDLNSVCKQSEENRKMYCACGDDFYKAGDSCWNKSSVGYTCNKNEECRSSHCSDGKCKCDENSIEFEGKCFKKSKVGKQCEDTVQCVNVIENSICKDFICTCKKQHFLSDDKTKCLYKTKRSYNETCESTYQCSYEYSKCNEDDICICEDGYSYINDKCVNSANISSISIVLSMFVVLILTKTGF